jgi:hypothetical protein
MTHIACISAPGMSFPTGENSASCLKDKDQLQAELDRTASENRRLRADIELLWDILCAGKRSDSLCA